MFDPRIYRAALLPAVAAFVLLMFSLGPVPGGLQEPVSAPTFDGPEAARTARSIVTLAPEREPGSPGDLAVADLVRERFGSIEGGAVSVQDYESTYDGEEVGMRNVLLTLPGGSEQTILVVAHRDSAAGPGAATSAAATAELVGLADNLGGSRHARTIILASTDGGSEGASGVRELIEGLARPGDIDEALVISQPGVRDAAPPFVVAAGPGPDSASAELLQTARASASSAFDLRDESPGPWGGLARLAVPFGLGEQAALRDEGIEALALSSAGERQVEPERDAVVSRSSIEASGAAMLQLILTLDEAENAPATDPADYIRLGDNLIPGWTLSLLAIALILAALLAAADTWLREYRADWRTRRTIPWALERALIPLAALVLAYVLGFVGLIPDPPYPYDPGRFDAGVEAALAFLALVAAFGLSGLLIRPLRTPLDAEPHALAASAGLMAGIALVGVWLINPYLGLLLSPAAHVWLLPARAAGPPRASLVAVAAGLSLVPALAAFATVGSQLDLGLAAPWHLLLLIQSGGIGVGMSLLWCLMLGGLIAAAAAAASGGRRTERPLPPILGSSSQIARDPLRSRPPVLRGR